MREDITASDITISAANVEDTNRAGKRSEKLTRKTTAIPSENNSETPSEDNSGKKEKTVTTEDVNFPQGLSFLRENTNNKVRGRKDIENLSIPFAGEIPLKTDIDKNKSVHLKQSIIF